MTSPLSAADLYHVGVVVSDLEATAARLSAVAGYRWTKTLEYTVPVTTPAGDLEVPFRLCFSVQAPHLELVAEIPGTLWTAAPGGTTHHLGYWVDDIETVSAELSACGFAFEAGPRGDGPPTFAYHLDSGGTRIEIVDRAMFGDWAGFLETMS
ncbi:MULTISPECIES: VOC family protein [Mycobacteriaceae]|uniref:VOC family protein n=1 Tax=Mycobacteriaceae TaxID=1762 RepID=UPI0007FDF184|nr:MULTISPECIES: VOC family protein [Mycobacteriaceae]MCK0176557.1 VOC family protein [Mycolicibacterium sp. F2034L]OBB55918.1 bleomycin resistance protein [Mycobacterium sp. 852013-51886_SCH5428379]